MTHPVRSLAALGLIGLLLVSCTDDASPSASTAAPTVTNGRDDNAGVDNANVGSANVESEGLGDEQPDITDDRPSAEEPGPSLWALTEEGDLVELDGNTGQERSSTELSATRPYYATAAYADGSVWVQESGSSSVLRVPVDEPAAFERIELGMPSCCLVADEEVGVWVAGTRIAVAGRIDPERAALTVTAEVGEAIGTVVPAGDSVYVLLDEADEVVQLDLDGRELARQPVPGLVPLGAVTDDVLVVSTADGLLVLERGALATVRLIDANASDMASAGDDVWVAGDDILRLNTSSGETVRWADVHQLLGVEVSDDRVYVTDLQGAVYAGTTDEPGLAPIAATARILSLVFPPAHSTSIAAAATSAIEVPAGVSWSEVALPSGAPLSTTFAVSSTDDGYLVVGAEATPTGSTPAIWASADGASFEPTFVFPASTVDEDVVLLDATSRGGTAVAVGAHDACRAKTVFARAAISCVARGANIWYSDEGGRWREATDTDGSFAAVPDTLLTEVIPTATGFVALGTRLEGAVATYGIWHSPDAHSWTLTADFTDPEGNFSSMSAATAGDAVLVALRMRCTAESGGPTLLRSTDGIAWSEVDRVASGLYDETGPARCISGGLPEGLESFALGSVTTIGDEALWAGPTGFFTSSDGSTWMPLEGVPGEFSAQSFETPWTLGTGPDDLLLLSPSGPALANRTASFDGVEWRDWSGLVGGDVVTSVSYAGRSAPVRLSDVALGPSGAVAAGRWARLDDDIPLRAVAYVSRAGVVGTHAICDVTLDCDEGALRGDRLSGADFTGRQWGGVVLVGVDLSESVLASIGLAGSQVIASDLSHSQLRGADLRGANAIDSSFEAADLTNADLSFALMGDAPTATFVDARLTLTTFITRNLRDADFSGADLGGARFLEADLSGARFAGAALDGTTWWGSTCPDGVVLALRLDATCDGHFID